MPGLIVRDRRLLTCPDTRKLAVCAGSDPCGPPSDLLCVVECAKELEGCPECIAFKPEALPYYPTFDHFLWNNRCWHVTGPFAGDPVCVVEEPPFAIVPAVGPCGATGCTDNCLGRPCICEDTDMPDIDFSQVNLTNASARISVQIDLHGECSVNNQTGIASGSRASLTFDMISRSLSYTSSYGGLQINYVPATDDLLAASYSGVGRYIPNRCVGGSESCQAQSYGLSDFLGVDADLNMQLYFVRDAPGSCTWRLGGVVSATAGKSDFNCQSCPGWPSACDVQEMRSAVDASAQGAQTLPIVTGTPLGGTGVADMGWWWSDAGVWAPVTGRVTLRLTIPSLGATCTDAFDCVPVVTPTPRTNAPSSLARGESFPGDSEGGTGGRPGDFL